MHLSNLTSLYVLHVHIFLPNTDVGINVYSRDSACDNPPCKEMNHIKKRSRVEKINSMRNSSLSSACLIYCAWVAADAKWTWSRERLPCQALRTEFTDDAQQGPDHMIMTSADKDTLFHHSNVEETFSALNS